MAKFMIKNCDSLGEKSFEIVAGEIEKRENSILYKYKSKLGECEIEHFSDRVIITRKGELPLLIDINLKKKTEFIYLNSGIKTIFLVEGIYITYDEKTDIFEFCYKIYDKKTEINKIIMGLKRISN